jgi:hypothetical protein
MGGIVLCKIKALKVIAQGTAIADERRISRNLKGFLCKERRRVGIYQNVKVAT